MNEKEIFSVFVVARISLFISQSVFNFYCTFFYFYLFIYFFGYSFYFLGLVMVVISMLFRL